MSEIFCFPHGNRPGDVYTPCDVEPPCEGKGLELVAASLPMPTNDPVRRPAHYIHGQVEAIDIIEHVIAGYPTHLAYLIGSALKYLVRAPYKHPTVSEDLKKAQWYLNRAVNKLG